MKNEKDENVIHNLFAEFHYADDLGVIKSKLAEYVATIRKEERQATWRDAIAEIESVARLASQGSVVALACVKIIERFEAAATEGKK